MTAPLYEVEKSEDTIVIQGRVEKTSSLQIVFGMNKRSSTAPSSKAWLALACVL